MDFRAHLEEYLNEAYEGDIQKANRILKSADHHLSLKQSTNTYTLLVPSESRKSPYTVTLENNEEYFLNANCTCLAFKETGDCKHSVAAVIYLLEKMEQKPNGNKKEIAQTMPTLSATGRQMDGSFIFEMTEINPNQLLRLTGISKIRELQAMTNKVGAPVIDGEYIRFPIAESKKSIVEVTIYYDRHKKFLITCTCGKTDILMCLHAAASFYYLLYVHGPYYFNQFKSYENEKNEILNKYGLTLNDPEAAEFKWGLDHFGSLKLLSQPDYMVSIGNTHFLTSFKKTIQNEEHASSPLRPALPDQVIIDYEIGFLLNFCSTRHSGFELEPLQISHNRGKEKITKLKLIPSNHPLLNPLPEKLYYALLEFSDEAILEWISKNGSPYINSYYSNPWSQLTPETNDKLLQHQTYMMRGMWPLLAENPYLYLLKEGRYVLANLHRVKLSDEVIDISFRVHRTDKFIAVHLQHKLNGVLIDEKVRLLGGGMLFELNNTLYLPADEKSNRLLQQFKHGKLVFPLAEKKSVVLNVLLPLQQKYMVEITGDLEFDIVKPDMKPRVMLSEFNNQMLLLRPQFQYDEAIVNYNIESEEVLTENGRLKIIKRNKPEERKLYDFLRTLHPRFATQNNNQNYNLPFTEVMKNNWFFTMIKQVEAAGYVIYGLNDLKKFRYNISVPKINIEASSGTDWFDLKMSAQWGDQVINLKDLRKAIVNRQEAVLLDDGTLGIIPKEWISQYATLLKISDEKNGTLRVSKLHFGLLDQLDALKDQTVTEEINKKKSRLKEFNGIKSTAPSSLLQANLRPYQLAGFQWMQTLDELGWGGCLADDMGLGKTLQAITFLQYLKEKNPGSTSLVVCPTSLLFNWENELRKFCPTLKYHIYYGLQRAFSHAHFEEYDVVLTSYGVARNDLQELLEFQWQYVILDESQAIKNPEAQVTRAVSHLKAKNKLILSGTPVQNNTQDLYAQFNFLNPGLLGTREFFKEEFGQSIDRNQDKEKAEQLRKLVYPFMLRRTKEQVAKDLPDKTETILWCSMGKAQRKLYEEYKNHYRNLLLKKIDEEGIGKAGIYVLEGLLRLRQICDHPLLLKDKDNVLNESVKSEELLREIQENTGEHKLLVFSQFTEMLQLIKNELQKNKIKFCYLDGSTAASKRKSQVEEFQNNTEIKVFLISLKAGGVGLNLTAADYVYLVDPWWNPAAEQQAIDRTHRIGQTRKIFAYKMICKDSVEEKILQLQQKKKVLAQELVGEEDGVTKKLTRDDVAFLFS